MILNTCGDIALKQWQWLTEQYLYTKSHAFVVMPNHIHGILEINRDFVVVDLGTGVVYAGTGRDLSLHNTLIAINRRIQNNHL